MTVLRGDFDTRRIVQDRLNIHIQTCEQQDVERDEAIRAALRNEFLTRMRFERFVASTFIERAKWLLFGAHDQIKKKDPVVVDQTKNDDAVAEEKANR